jgi:hypothetical protein
MAIEPDPALIRRTAADFAKARAAAALTAVKNGQDGQFAEFLAWALGLQAAYERARAARRIHHPLIDVKALEEAYGVAPDILSIAQLKASAPAIIVKQPKVTEGQA